MKPTDLMRQTKALLPTDSRPCTTFMAMFLLRLPLEIKDHVHLITKDFKDCTMYIHGGICTLLHSAAVAAINTDTKKNAINAVSGGHRREFSPRNQPLPESQGSQPQKDPRPAAGP